MITVTEVAAEKIKLQLAKRNKGHGIKIGLKKSGCSGFSYVLEFVDVLPDLDETAVYEMHGARVFIDMKHLPYLLGMTLDWKKQGLNEGFEFINPNVKSECGCGESFNV